MMSLRKSKQLLLIFVGLIILGLTLFEVANYYSGKAVSSNREGLVGDLDNLGIIARQFYKRPASELGGGNSFSGWTIPSRFDTTPNGIYKATVLLQDIRIIGTGYESNGGRPIVHEAIITPTGVTIVEKN